MNIKYLTLGVLAAGVLAGCNNTPAQPIQQAPAPIQAPAVQHAPAQQAPVQHAPAQIVNKPALALSTIIANAEREVKGLAINIDAYGIDSRGVPETYEVEVINSTNEYTVYVDAATGQILSVRGERDVNILPNNKVKLAQAVEIAQKHVSGYLISADHEREVRGNYYKVRVISGERPYKVYVDASTGAVLDSRIDYDD